ncbi:unnamed protein product [Symbiodinium natans]|uniref:Uncharacterized protein n=1 Tax=Symbiodinium natans TaxID=878477 RepID=A0A812UUD5_9DINO|nr:unnamed protein product [Symbiodinium natans]
MPHGWALLGTFISLLLHLCTDALRSSATDDAAVNQIAPTEDDATVELKGQGKDSIQLEDGPGYSTVLKNGTGRLENLAGRQVVAVGGKDTSFATSFVVVPIWAKLENGTKPYQVRLLPLGSQPANQILFGLGLIPACVAVYVALLTLPRFLLDLATQNDLWKQTTKPEDRNKDLVQLEHYADKLGIEMQPAFNLRESPFAKAAQHQLTLWGLCIFATGQFLVSVIFHAWLLADEPFMVSLEIAETFLILLCCISVALGMKAAAKLKEEEANCPCEIMMMKPIWERLFGTRREPQTEEASHDAEKKEDQNKRKGLEKVDIKTGLANHLLVMSLLPFVPTLLLIYWCPSSWTVDSILTTPIFAMYKATELLNNECLLYCLFFQFMLDTSVVARTVQSHVDALAERIEGEISEEEKEYFDKDDGRTLRPDNKDPFTEGFMTSVHRYIVKLATSVLPRLSTISGPILLFAMCNWSLGFLRMFRHLAVAAGGLPMYRAATSVLQVLFVHLPIGLLCLLPLAQVSDACDLLKEKLNNLRNVVSETGDEHRIQLTENYMQGANRGQGLGYELYGTGVIVTKRALLAMFAKAAGLASLVLSVTYQIIRLQRGYRLGLASNGSSIH